MKNVERDKNKRKYMHLWKYSSVTLVWETIKETNLNTDFYFHKYYLTLIKWKKKNAQYKYFSWCGNFVERHRFRIVWGESPETMRKLHLSRKFPHYEIKWNYGIFHNECKWPEAALRRCFSEKVYCEDAANLQKITHVELWFQ